MAHANASGNPGSVASTFHRLRVGCLAYLPFRAVSPHEQPSNKLLASGVRTAATIAPIGAVIGEWVGASKGLGFLILNANARMQIDLMFAALIILVMLTLAFYLFVDWLTAVPGELTNG